jgi:AraC-like DNA-binding protein
MSSFGLYIQFSAAAVLIFCSILLFAYKNRTFAHNNLAGIYFALSVILFAQWIFSSGNAGNFRYLLFQDTAVAFLIGPCVYFYLIAITGGQLPGMRLYAINFLPAAATAAGTAYETVTNARLAMAFELRSPKLPDTSISSFIYYTDIISSIHAFSYVVLSIIAIAPVLRNRKHRSATELRFVLIYMLCIAMFIFGVILTDLLRRPTENTVFLSLLLFFGVLYFVFSARFPNFTLNAIKEGRRIRDDNSPVNPDDATTVTNRLEKLMNTDRIFTEETLTLNKTAEKMGITPHLLSRVLNISLHTNFRTYLNSFRIEEAKRLLADSEEISILEIAYRTGFNSKSAFNNTFLKMTGMPPRDFRNRKALPLKTDGRNHP